MSPVKVTVDVHGQTGVFQANETYLNISSFVKIVVLQTSKNSKKNEQVRNRKKRKRNFPTFCVILFNFD